MEPGTLLNFEFPVIESVLEGSKVLQMAEGGQPVIAAVVGEAKDEEEYVLLVFSMR